MRSCLAGAALVAVLGITSPAAGQDRARCVSAYEQGQVLRRGKQLLQARAELLICARDPCPRALRPECVEWLDEVQHGLPSIVPVARTADGRDATGVHLFVDGTLVREELDGKAIEMDPGIHVLRFQTHALPPVEERVVVREGEKERAIVAAFPPAPNETSSIQAIVPPSPAAPAVPPNRQTYSASNGAGQRLAGWLTLGAGALSTGGAAVFGVLGLQARDQFNASGQTDVSAQGRAITFRTVANVCWVVAGVGAVGGGVLLLTAPHGGALHAGLGSLEWVAPF